MTNIDLASLPRLSSPAEHRADLGAAVAATPRPEARVSGLERLAAAMRWLDDSWIGDAIGTALTFAAGYGLILVALVLS